MAEIALCMIAEPMTEQRCVFLVDNKIYGWAPT